MHSRRMWTIHSRSHLLEGVSLPGGYLPCWLGRSAAMAGACLARGVCLPCQGGMPTLPGGCACLARGVPALPEGCLPALPGGCLPCQGVPALPRGVCRRGVSQHALRQTARGHTDRCKNITFATSLRTVKIGSSFNVPFTESNGRHDRHFSHSPVLSANKRFTYVPNDQVRLHCSGLLRDRRLIHSNLYFGNVVFKFSRNSRS